MFLSLLYVTESNLVLKNKTNELTIFFQAKAAPLFSQTCFYHITVIWKSQRMFYMFNEISQKTRGFSLPSQNWKYICQSEFDLLKFFIKRFIYLQIRVNREGGEIGRDLPPVTLLLKWLQWLKLGEPLRFATWVAWAHSCGPSSTAFQGPVARSQIGTRAGGIYIGTHTRCQLQRQWCYQLHHNASF